MEHIAKINGTEYTINAYPYTPNEFYTEEQFNKNLHNSLIRKWDSYNTSMQMLSDMFRDETSEPDSTDSPSIAASIALNTAFVLELMRYLLIVAPEYIKDAAYVNFNQSSGTLDVWPLDENGNYLNTKEYSILL